MRCFNERLKNTIGNEIYQLILPSLLLIGFLFYLFTIINLIVVKYL